METRVVVGICGHYRQLSANRFNPYYKAVEFSVQRLIVRCRVWSLGPPLSFLPEQVQHDGLHIMSKGTGSHHQPVRAEPGVSIDHTLSDIHPATSFF